MALTEKLSAIGDAIRDKTGKEDKLSLDQMPLEIASIETGGGGNGEFSYTCDDYAVHTKIITIGANTVTNAVGAWSYLQTLIDGVLNTAVLISPYGTVNNQFILRRFGENASISGTEGNGSKVVRYRNGAFNEANYASSYDAFLVEGSQYFLVSYVYPTI